MGKSKGVPWAHMAVPVPVGMCGAVCERGQEPAAGTMHVGAEV